MRKEYDLNSLNISKQNRSEYRNIVNSDLRYFVKANYRKSNQISVIINYDTENLLNHKDLKTANSIFKLQTIIALIDLIENTNPLFAINIHPDNIYFDQAANAYQLERMKNTKRLDEAEYIKQILSLVGSMFLKDSFDSIYAANASIINKQKELKDLIEVTSFTRLRTIVNKRIDEEMERQSQQLVSVPKNYYRKNKNIGRLKILIIIILMALLAFLMLVYIPNRNSQLTAYMDYNKKVYEDVITDLSDTSIKSMTPVTKYILSESAVRLSPFTTAQKENILANLTPNVDEGILDFWVYIAQGDIDRAYEQSISNNDAQQKAFALLIYIDQVQNDPDLDASEKQNQIETYQSELDAINDSITSEEAAGQE